MTTKRRLGDMTLLTMPGITSLRHNAYIMLRGYCHKCKRHTGSANVRMGTKFHWMCFNCNYTVECYWPVEKEPAAHFWESP